MFHEGRSIAISILEIGFELRPGDAATLAAGRTVAFSKSLSVRDGYFQNTRQGKSRKKIRRQEMIVTSISTARKALLHGELSRSSRKYADLQNTAARDSG